MTFQNFWHSFQLSVSGDDFITSFVKVLIYGIFIPIVASYCGLNSGSGPTEIGKATTKSVVVAGVLIITLDLVITWILRLLFLL